MRILASCVFFSLVLSPAFAHAAKMSAKIAVSKEYIEALEAKETAGDGAGSKDCYWKLPNSIISVEPPSVNFASDLAAVLFKDGEPPSKPDELATVKVHAGELEKNVVVTKPGNSIRFLNVSPYSQELYCSDIPVFKPEIQSGEQVRIIEFPSEGVFEIHSKQYPHFLAYIVVTGGKAVEIKPDGSIAEELEPGQYTLKVFHNGKWIHKQSFTVEGGRMDPLTITLTPGHEEAVASSVPSGTADKKSDEDKKVPDDKKAADNKAKEPKTAPQSKGSGN
jgi:hypothetical protein